MHRSFIADRVTPVGWFWYFWRYDYYVWWFGGNASIFDVYIYKTRKAKVVTPPNGPRMDLQPHNWFFRDQIVTFGFGHQQPGLGNLHEFIPPLVWVGPGRWVPVPPLGFFGLRLAMGHFRVFSMSSPAPHKASTQDFLMFRWPPPPLHLTVQAPNFEEEIGDIAAMCRKTRRGYEYSYSLRAKRGKIRQGVIMLPKEVKISKTRVNRNKWSSFRAGFDGPKDKKRAVGRPSGHERGFLFVGSFDSSIGPRDGAVTVSFVSKSPPAQVTVQTSNFAANVIGPGVPASQRRPRTKPPVDQYEEWLLRNKLKGKSKPRKKAKRRSRAERGMTAKDAVLKVLSDAVEPLAAGQLVKAAAKLSGRAESTIRKQISTLAKGRQIRKFPHKGRGFKYTHVGGR
ncbi:MAG: hypothetical protein ACYS99_06010 [Planctomycetota bacterium]|jgi:hypothetical protein